MKRMLVFPGATQERTEHPELGAHIVIDAERFSADIPRDEYRRLLHRWFEAAVPRAHFECSRLTLGGE